MLFLCVLDTQCLEPRDDVWKRLAHNSEKVREMDDFDEDTRTNCDAVAQISWGGYFVCGMIVGFLLGTAGGIILGFVCWRIRVHKDPAKT
ncbi:unnamed protein product [Gongylonema pulchrum]|uniref:Uncharacterized protein n=1 Tax=Gongylonema pulchrum TaxID=637853 RepID=A0A3P6SP59_9BILA|nr:unnamed protein product [Gongylonema pulchrum]